MDRRLQQRRPHTRLLKVCRMCLSHVQSTGHPGRFLPRFARPRVRSAWSHTCSTSAQPVAPRCHVAYGKKATVTMTPLGAMRLDEVRRFRKPQPCLPRDSFYSFFMVHFCSHFLKVFTSELIHLEKQNSLVFLAPSESPRPRHVDDPQRRKCWPMVRTPLCPLGQATLSQEMAVSLGSKVA